MGAEVNIWMSRSLILCVLMIFTVGPRSLCNGAYVSSITPTSGGYGGQVKVTISGSGFSKEQFSLYSGENIGNLVYLVNAHGRQHSCSVQKEGSNQNRIIFYTPSGLKSKDTYNVKVAVDGQRIEDKSICGGKSSCSFSTQPLFTPTINVLTPQSGIPGSQVNISGILFTDRYTTDVATATNGKIQTLLRFGISLANQDSNYGLIECKTTGASVGFFNVSFLVDLPYGR
ncbi:fibrocystin-L-like [Ruditapes philippinarum]|uniref:fibrocystin-L-like n=1 Tax=Ruditapes philippinarum TaxID=129788 RepID=UPI00295B08E1|nr:fibrocystin-L-like [Ruditapes philippinarum]